MQKNDNSVLAIFKIVVAAFSINDKEEKIRFFDKICLLTNINSNIIYEITFLTLSDASVKFLDWHLF